MPVQPRKIFSSAILLLLFVTTAAAQSAPGFPTAVERQFSHIENDILSSAEAMPADGYYFTPDSLKINCGNFKGVRTFAGQVMHLATDNILIWSAVTGDSVRADITDVNGPPAIRTKAAIIQYLKASFAIGHKAVASLTAANAMGSIEFRGRQLPRLDLCFYALTHANEHYGQMALYLRMCGVIPPATMNEK